MVDSSACCSRYGDANNFTFHSSPHFYKKSYEQENAFGAARIEKAEVVDIMLATLLAVMILLGLFFFQSSYIGFVGV